MSTLLLTEIFPPKTGGSGRWFWELYRRLPREEFLVVAGEHPRQEEFDQAHDLRLVRVPFALRDWGIFNSQALGSYWTLLRAVVRIVKSERIGQIHCGRFLPEGWIAWMIRQSYRVPYVCYVHGEEAQLASTGESGGVLSSQQLRWMTRQVVRGADFAIANSRNTERILREEWGLPARRIRLLHPGVDIRQFVPAARNQIIRAQLGWGNRPVVLTVGRLQKRKGQDQLILALRAIRKAIPDVLYSIVGEGEESKNLRELVRKEGLGEHVQFLGELRDELLVRCYQQCDLFVLPNRQIGSDIEGFGMVLLEAQACGKPVVAGASGGTAETMRVPETGRVVNCESSRELAAVVIELLSNSHLWARMGQAARKWVVDEFDWTVLSRQAYNLFQQASADNSWAKSLQQ